MKLNREFLDKFRCKRVTKNQIPLPKLKKRKADFLELDETPVKSNVTQKRSRLDLSKKQKRESFFLFFPGARNNKEATNGFKCIICEENSMYLDVTNSWNAAHIRPIKHCPVRDARYVIPTCTSCNGRMGLSEVSQMNAFDMMVNFDYKDRIYPIAKVLHDRYAEEGVSVLSFIKETYGKPTENQHGIMDDTLIIESKIVYEEISNREVDEIRTNGQKNVDLKTMQIHSIHEEIRQLLEKVEEVRIEEKNALLTMFQNILNYTINKRKF